MEFRLCLLREDGFVQFYQRNLSSEAVDIIGLLGWQAE
jgi:hypothetical protein